MLSLDARGRTWACISEDAVAHGVDQAHQETSHLTHNDENALASKTLSDKNAYGVEPVQLGRAAPRQATYLARYTLLTDYGMCYLSIMVISTYRLW